MEPSNKGKRSVQLNPNMDFTGKVVIITGSSSGMGAAAAKLFSAHGAHVVIMGRDVERLNKVAEECLNAKGNAPLVLNLDLTEDGSCETVVEQTIEKYKKINVLINCAGKLNVSSLFDDTMEPLDELLALNVRVPYRLTKLCVPHLVKTKGNIVNIVSTKGRCRPGLLPYYMTRDALLIFTQAGAVELASVGVRMNCVRPGFARTNFPLNFNVAAENMNHVYEDLGKQLMPNREFIDPDEIARLILFAASDICPNMNAAELTLDSGCHLW